MRMLLEIASTTYENENCLGILLLASPILIGQSAELHRLGV